jgi:hypothetical protein
MRLCLPHPLNTLSGRNSGTKKAEPVPKLEIDSSGKSGFISKFYLNKIDTVALAAITASKVTTLL